MFQTLPSMGRNLMIIIRWEKPKVHTILISLAVFARYEEGARLERKSNWRVLNSMFSRWFCVDVPRTISRWNSIEQISLRLGPSTALSVSFSHVIRSFLIKRVWNEFRTWDSHHERNNSTDRMTSNHLPMCCVILVDCRSLVWFRSTRICATNFGEKNQNCSIVWGGGNKFLKIIFGFFVLPPATTILAKKNGRKRNGHSAFIFSIFTFHRFGAAVQMCRNDWLTKLFVIHMLLMHVCVCRVSTYELIWRKKHFKNESMPPQTAFLLFFANTHDCSSHLSAAVCGAKCWKLLFLQECSQHTAAAAAAASSMKCIFSLARATKMNSIKWKRTTRKKVFIFTSGVDVQQCVCVRVCVNNLLNRFWNELNWHTIDDTHALYTRTLHLIIWWQRQTLNNRYFGIQRIFKCALLHVHFNRGAATEEK